LGGKVRASFPASDRAYGARRICRDLLAEGVSVWIAPDRAIDAAARLSCTSTTCWIAASTQQLPAANDRGLHLYLDSKGWLSVAAVIDLFSRRVVGRSTNTAMTTQLVTDALVMAIWRRGKPDALLHHSDRGRQYISEQFQRLTTEHGIVCSMSRSGSRARRSLTRAVSGKSREASTQRNGLPLLLPPGNLAHAPRHEAADSQAICAVQRPNHRPTGAVWLRDYCIVRNVDPLAA
jgi:transposase InsO family protein